MRHMHPHHFRRGIRHGYRRIYHRPGQRLGLISLTALGYSLLNRKWNNQVSRNGTAYTDLSREE